MMTEISAGVTAWALLCWLLLAMLSASARHKSSAPRPAAVPFRLVSPVAAAFPQPRPHSRSGGSTTFTLDLDPYGLDAAMRRLVAGSVTPSK